MSNERQVPPDAMRVDHTAAQRLLARAAELDAFPESSSIAELRQAAREAGISSAAFEAALRELGEENGVSVYDETAAQSPAPLLEIPAQEGRGKRRMLRALAAAAVVVAVVLAVGAGVAGLSRERSVPVSVVPHTTRAVRAEAPRVIISKPLYDEVQRAMREAAAQPSPKR